MELPVSLDEQCADYQRMEAVLAWLADHWRERPALEEIAEQVGLSSFHFQRVFTRWAGVSPKAFMAAIAHAEARRALAEGASVLEAAFDVGLSGPSRLHDLFIAQERMTPGEARRRGEGLEMTLGRAPTPFGQGVFATTDRGLAGLGFCTPGDVQAAQDLKARWPAATWRDDDAVAQRYTDQIFGPNPTPTPLVLIGPPFRVQVWKALLTIPRGATVSYAEVARRAGSPGAYRAVGAAIGANPISWLIPCHRALSRDGRLTGYHWGLPRKAAMLGREAVEVAA